MKNDIGSILKKEFESRKVNNPKYSLRAFSRDIKISPGFLSEVMQSKKKISVDKAMEIGQRLGWSWRESQILLQTSQLGLAKSKRAQKFLKLEISNSEALYGKFERLKVTQFSSVSNWYCMAILEMTELPSFKADPKLIAQQLGIQTQEADVAFEKLKAADFIAQNPDGRWVKKINASVKDTPSIAEIRKFHRQHLVNAAQALEEQAPENRNISGITMAINSKRIPEALELIREFRSRMSSLLETGEKDKVYHLAIQLFQLDHQKGQTK